MRKVVLFIASSLEGYIARRDGSVDWLFHDADYGITSFLTSVDTVFIGRKTHDTMRGFGMPAYKGKKNYVFTRRAPPACHPEVEYTAARPRELVEKLRRREGRDMWLVGGAELASAFLADDVIDEVVLSVHPIILGEGIPLFLPGSPCMKLSLKNSTKYDSGLVQLHYGVLRK